MHQLLLSDVDRIFSGQIAPIALFPAGMQADLARVPAVSVHDRLSPASIFLRRVSGHEIFAGYAIQVGWIVAAMVISAVLWRGGIKRYTAFGI